MVLIKYESRRYKDIGCRWWWVSIMVPKKESSGQSLTAGPPTQLAYEICVYAESSYRDFSRQEGPIVHDHALLERRAKARAEARRQGINFEYQYQGRPPALKGLDLVEHRIRERLSCYQEEGNWFSCEPTTALTALKTEMREFTTKVESIKIPSVFKSEYTRGPSPLSSIVFEIEVTK